MLADYELAWNFLHAKLEKDTQVPFRQTTMVGIEIAVEMPEG